MVEVGTGTKGTRFLRTEYPIEEGLVLGTTKIHGREASLVAEEGSLVPIKQREGIYC